HRFACWHPVDGPLRVVGENGQAASGAKAADRPLQQEVAAEAVALVPGEPLLQVTDLVKEYPVTSGAILQGKIGAVHAVSGVSFTVNAGETFGLVGESGCGKTTIGKVV